MILIDGPMPKRCAECPCFDDTMYGKCRVKDVWLGAKDGAWFTEQRPSWCPLEEVKDDEEMQVKRNSKGEWEKRFGDGEKVRTCSVCGISQTVNVYQGKVRFNYCPYCGADMR